MQATSAVDQGDWLAEHRWEMDRGESSWLMALAAFDHFQGWAVDGQLSCAEWLMWRTQMARATAYEKLRIARQLRARPTIADAFAAGRLSYSAVRAITRIEDPDPAVDESLVVLAEAGSVADVERMVRYYQLHADQHRPPSDPAGRRGLRVRPGVDGTATVEITLTEVEVEELMAVIDAFVGPEAPQDSDVPLPESGSSSGDSSEGCEAESSREDSTSLMLIDERSWPQRRADAAMEMARVALAHAAEGGAAGADRYLVHVVTTVEGEMELLDGTPIDPATAGRIGCDASRVTHGIDTERQPLFLGRRTREWNTAQRRAIAVRDGGRCRFPGCERRVADVHHHLWWSRGGPTDVSNGYLACARHHTLLHEGYGATGDPNHTLTFTRPDGSVLGYSTTVRRRRPAT